MALSKQEIENILGAKNLTCSNLNEYKNLDTLLHLTCKNGHKIDATLKTVRNAHFQCPYCQGNESIGDKLDGLTIPKKEGYRIVAVDNATENAGVSVFDDGKLVFYHLFHFSGDLIGRIIKNKNVVRDIFIQQWQPDLLVFEDIQEQRNVLVFKSLAMLLGNVLVVARENNIKTETVLSKVWRAHFMIGGKTRPDQKAEAIRKVNEMYGLKLTDDIAEAILLGKYAVDVLHRQEMRKKLF